MVTGYRLGLGMLALTLALVACERPRDAAFMNRGGPEALIDVSSEAVNLNIGNKKDVDALAQWIAADAPSRADLQCDLSNKNCKDAVKVLEKKGVEITTSPSPANMVTLVYERILARDCNQRYRESKTEMYNVAAPSFGCSVSANIVQHVSDKSAFVNPAISDVPMAKYSVKAAERMGTERTKASEYGVQTSLAGAAKTAD